MVLGTTMDSIFLIIARAYFTRKIEKLVCIKRRTLYSTAPKNCPLTRITYIVLIQNDEGENREYFLKPEVFL